LEYDDNVKYLGQWKCESPDISEWILIYAEDSRLLLETLSVLSGNPDEVNSSKENLLAILDDGKRFFVVSQKWKDHLTKVIDAEYLQIEPDGRLAVGRLDVGEYDYWQPVPFGDEGPAHILTLDDIRFVPPESVGKATPIFRTWTDSSGKFTLEAAFVKRAMDTVTLEKRDGETTEVRFDRLSEDDQSYIESR
jgi:hypothetical protein